MSAISRVGTGRGGGPCGAAGVDADDAVIRMGEYVPPMFTFRDPDGNRFRMVERE